MPFENPENVIYLNKSNQSIETDASPSSSTVSHSLQSEDAIQAIMVKNRDNLERMQRDRSKANKAVLKSYRLK